MTRIAFSLKLIVGTFLMTCISPITVKKKNSANDKLKIIHILGAQKRLVP